VAHLSQKLKKKEHQLEMAEHKIDMLVKAVRSLEEHMTRLTDMGKLTTPPSHLDETSQPLLDSSKGLRSLLSGTASGFWSKQSEEGGAGSGDEEDMTNDHSIPKPSMNGDRGADADRPGRNGTTGGRAQVRIKLHQPLKAIGGSPCLLC
jgi:hypothetical protein